MLSFSITRWYSVPLSLSVYSVCGCPWLFVVWLLEFTGVCVVVSSFRVCMCCLMVFKLAVSLLLAWFVCLVVVVLVVVLVVVSVVSLSFVCMYCCLLLSVLVVFLSCVCENVSNDFSVYVFGFLCVVCVSLSEYLSLSESISIFFAAVVFIFLLLPAILMCRSRSSCPLFLSIDFLNFVCSLRRASPLGDSMIVFGVFSLSVPLFSSE